MLTQDFKEGEKQNSSSAENLLLINLSRTQSLGVTPPLDTGEDFHLETVCGSTGASVSKHCRRAEIMRLSACFRMLEAS